MQTVEFELNGTTLSEAEAAPTVYDYEVGAVMPFGVVIVIFSGEFLQL